ncbi:hypothetical protein ACSBR2_026254 [Camellia fascicularis]
MRKKITFHPYRNLQVSHFPMRLLSQGMASMRRTDCCLFIILTCLVVSLIFSVHASLLGDTLTVGPGYERLGIL